jgi:protein SCO1
MEALVKKLLVLVVLAVVAAGCGGSKKPAVAYRGTNLSPPQAAPGFTLTDQSGRKVSLAGERGHYAIVTFLYTHCPDVCPVIAGSLNRLLGMPIAHRTGLRVLAVSVDPKRDTPAAVRHFVSVHRLVPPFRYLTGTRAQLAPIWHDYHVAAAALPNGTIAHSTFEILVDPQGRERVIYDAQATPADFAHDLAILDSSA